jgi:hypothetical protein
MPTAWVDTRARWAEYVDAADTMRTRLIASVLDGGGDIAGLKSAALAEQYAGGRDGHVLDQNVGAAVLGRLLAVYRPAAERNFKSIATQFDRAAKTFHDTCRAVDVECDPAALLAAPTTAREAWFAAPQLAEQLDALVWPLTAAARLAGATDDVDQEHRLQLGLCVDAAKAHRRRVAETWLDRRRDGRTGRWGRLVGLGSKLRAATDPDTLYPPLPAYVAAIDTDRRVTHWDPIDGKLPQGWAASLDGWIDETAAWSL